MGSFITGFHDSWPSTGNDTIPVPYELGGKFFGHLIIFMVGICPSRSENAHTRPYFCQFLKSLNKFSHHPEYNPGIRAFDLTPISICERPSNSLFIFRISHV